MQIRRRAKYKALAWVVVFAIFFIVLVANALAWPRWSFYCWWC